MSVSRNLQFFVIVTATATCLLAWARLCGSHSYHSPATQRQTRQYHGDQQEPFRIASTYFDNEPEHELLADNADDGGGGRVKLSSSIFLSNGRYHRSTTTTPRPYIPLKSQPYFGRSSTRTGSTVVPQEGGTTSVYSSETAIQFPDSNTTLTTSTTMSPGTISRGGTHGSNQHNHNHGRGGKRGKIPLNLLRKLSNEHDVTQIFAKYVSNVKIEDVNGHKRLVNLQGSPLNIELGGAPLIMQNTTDAPKTGPKITGFSDRTVSKPTAAAQRVSTYAGCEPELQTVELPAPNDPSVVQYPRCVRLKRCGGCCASDLLSCESIQSETTDVQVQKFSYNDESEKLEYKETETIPMTVDLSCRCNCRVKSHDCSSRHEYSSDDCACVCKNTRESEVCLRQPHKLWDPNLCQCVCRETLACSSGYSFDLDTCQCARMPEETFGVSTIGTRARRRPDSMEAVDRSSTFRARN